MDSISAQLTSIICGKCSCPLVQKKLINEVTYYYCACAQKIRVLLTCTYCKKHFLNLPYLIRKTNYCSLKCYWTGTDKKQIRVCQSCHKEFYADAALIKKGYGFYCSRDCWFTIFKGWKQEVKCRECQKTFLVIRAVYKKHPKFCSKRCSDNSKIDNIFRVCRNCKNSFRLTQSALNRGRGSFCTWVCYKKYKGESSLELLVRQQLEKLNEPFQQEMKFGRFRADFYLPKRNLIIECDGEYWHMIQKIRLRDQRKDKLFKKLGYRILRLKGQAIIKNDFTLSAFIT